jgi:hypothetical protein
MQKVNDLFLGLYVELPAVQAPHVFYAVYTGLSLLVSASEVFFPPYFTLLEGSFIFITSLPTPKTILPFPLKNSFPFLPSSYRQYGSGTGTGIAYCNDRSSPTFSSFR